MNEAKIKEMNDAVNAELDARYTWDTNQQAEVLRGAGYTTDEIKEYFEELVPF